MAAVRASRGAWRRQMSAGGTRRTPLCTTSPSLPDLLDSIGDVAHPAWRARTVGTYRLWRHRASWLRSACTRPVRNSVTTDTPAQNTPMGIVIVDLQPEGGPHVLRSHLLDLQEDDLGRLRFAR